MPIFRRSRKSSPSEPICAPRSSRWLTRCTKQMRRLVDQLVAASGFTPGARSFRQGASPRQPDQRSFNAARADGIQAHSGASQSCLGGSARNRQPRCPTTTSPTSRNSFSRSAIGANSIFARHARETFVATRADATIDENVAIQRDLDATVANLVSAAQDGVKRSTADA